MTAPTVPAPPFGVAGPPTGPPPVPPNAPPTASSSSLSPVLLIVGVAVLAGAMVTVVAILAVTFLGRKATSTTTSSPSSVVAGATTTTTTGTTAGTPTSSALATPGSTRFVDPAGVYELTIGDDWQSSTRVPGATSWDVGAAGTEPSATVNVVTQPLPAPMSSDELATSVKSGLTRLNSIIVASQEPVTLDDGTTAVVLNIYNNMVTGTPVWQSELVTTNGSQAVFVTVSAKHQEALATPSKAIRSLHLL